MAIAAVAPKMRTVLVAFSLVVLVGCAPIYGANFDFPDEPATPGTANAGAILPICGRVSAMHFGTQSNRVT